MNDLANNFACAIASCNAGVGLCTATFGGPCTITVCQFDANIPSITTTPYTTSQVATASCTAATCLQASDPAKTSCNGFLCCKLTELSFEPNFSIMDYCRQSSSG